MSDGTGDDDGTSWGNDWGADIELENDFAGAKSWSVKRWGLKGKIPVEENAECISLGVIDAGRTLMYSSIILYLSIVTLLRMQ
jgi:hypothetical protein